MPLGRALVLMRDVKYACLVPRASDDLQTDGETGVGETTRNRNRGNARHVKGRGERGEVLREGDGIVSKARRRNARRGRDKKIHVMEKSIERAYEFRLPPPR